MLQSGLFSGGGALQYEVGPKIFRADILVRSQCCRSPFLKDGTFVQEICPVSDGERLTHIVVGDDHADVLVLELGDDELYVFHCDRVNSGERLVQKDELRIYGQGAGYLAAAPFTTGKLDAEALAYL